MRGLDGVACELPFAFAVDDVLIRGRFDLYHRGADGSALVVDYKTNLLGDRDAGRAGRAQLPPPGRRSTRWRRCWAGADAVEMAYAFLDRPDAVVGAELHARAT